MAVPVCSITIVNESKQKYPVPFEVPTSIGTNTSTIAIIVLRPSLLREHGIA